MEHIEHRTVPPRDRCRTIGRRSYHVVERSRWGLVGTVAVHTAGESGALRCSIYPAVLKVESSCWTLRDSQRKKLRVASCRVFFRFARQNGTRANSGHEGALSQRPLRATDFRATFTTWFTFPNACDWTCGSTVSECAMFAHRGTSPV